jgi:hypothetical protein
VWDGGMHPFKHKPKFQVRKYTDTKWIEEVLGNPFPMSLTHYEEHQTDGALIEVQQDHPAYTSLCIQMSMDDDIPCYKFNFEQRPNLTDSEIIRIIMITDREGYSYTSRHYINSIPYIGRTVCVPAGCQVALWYGGLLESTRTSKVINIINSIILINRPLYINHQ